MAYDSLKQVGKYINKSGKDADRSLKRVSPINPKLERVRDVFDDLTPFEMTFYVKDQDERVVLDLFFNLPPPIRGCKIGCIISKCESFDYTSGNHAVTVQNPYLAGTVSVYLDGEKLEGSQMAETNPDGGEVFFQGGSYETVTICYIYLDEGCESPSGLCLLHFLPSFAGAELVFCDRFDKSPTLETLCGLGYWYDGTFGVNLLTVPPYAIPTLGGLGSINIPRTGKYVFENVQGANVISETVWVADFRNWAGGATVSGTGASSFAYSLGVEVGVGVSVTINGNGHSISLTRQFRYRQTPSDAWGSGTATETYAIPIPPEKMRQFMVGRFFVGPDTVAFKMWPLNEDEPTTGWVTFSNTPLTNTSPNINIGGLPASTTFEYYDIDFVGGSIGGSRSVSFVSIPIGVLSIQHWIGRNQIFGRWPQLGLEPLPGYSWTHTTPKPQETADYIAAHPNVYFQADDYGTANTLTQFQNTGFALPSNLYSYVTPFFGGPTIEAADQRNLLSGTSHTAVSYDMRIGKPTTMRISGQVQWAQDSASRGIIPHLTVQLQAMSYGGETPNVGGGWIYGEVKQTIFMPFSSTESVELLGASDSYSGWRSKSDWVDFQIEVPTSGYHFQWSVRFLETGLEIQDYLGYLAVDSILRSTAVHTNLRNIWYEAIMNPISTVKDLCDVGPLSGRCEQIIENFATSYLLDYDTLAETGVVNFQGMPTLSITTYNTVYNGENTNWNLSVNYPKVTKIDITNASYKTQFRARGITVDGDDGRAPRETNNTALILATTSQTSTASSALTTTDNPVVCGDHSVSLQFRYGNMPGTWVTNTGSTQFPLLQVQISSSKDGSTTGAKGFFLLTNGLVTALFSDTQQLDGRSITLAQNTWYNLYGEMTSTEGRWKFWPVGNSEPSAWTIQYPMSSTLKNTFGISTTFTNFITDDTYTEFRNINVLSMESAI